jgi:hypothetical protein
MRHERGVCITVVLPYTVSFMESSSRSFLPRLEEALALRAAWLESAVLPALKDASFTYRSLFEGIAGTLVKKGLLREDLYDYERKVSGISVPPDAVLPGAGDSNELSRRIVAFRRQLDYLVDEMPFTLAAMDLPAVEGISALVSYIDWERFGEGSQSPTTRALAQLTTRLRQGKDQLSVSLLHESQAHIRESARDMRHHLAEIQAWHHESWKAAVRAKALPQILPRLTRAEEERVAETVLIREAFTRALPGSTWHPELVHQVLAEDEETLLASLAVPHARPAATESGADQKAALLDAVRGVCKVARDIGYCQDVLARNELAAEKPRLGIFRRFLRWIRRTPGTIGERRYDIEYRASANAEAVTEPVDFVRFLAEVQELRTLLGDIARAGSRDARRIQGMDAEQLTEFLTWLLRQVRQVYRRMDGLNTLFQAARGGGTRGIKLELLAIENAMKRAEGAHRVFAVRGDGDAPRDGAGRP